MQYRVKFTTYDQELVDILDRLGTKKPKFVELALGCFIHSQKGHEMSKNFLADKGKTPKKPVVSKNTDSVLLKTSDSRANRTIKNTESVFLEPGNTEKTAKVIEKPARAGDIIDLDKFL